MKKIHNLYRVALAIVAVAALILPLACGKEANAADIGGTWKYAADGEPFDLLVGIADADPGDGKPVPMVIMGTYIPEQNPDWLYFQPVPVQVEKNEYLFVPPSSHVAEETTIRVHFEGEDLIGTWSTPTAQGTVLMKRLSPEENRGSITGSRYDEDSPADGEEAPGAKNAAVAEDAEPEEDYYYDREDPVTNMEASFADYVLARLYAKAVKDPGTKTAYAVFEDASAIEGEVLLTFTEKGSKALYWSEEAGSNLVKTFYHSEFGAAENRIGEQFVLRYREGTRIDERGEEVAVRIPLAAIPFDMEAFTDFGFKRANKVYQFLDELAEGARAGKIAMLADIALYPLEVRAPDGSVFTFNNAKELGEHAKDLFNGKVVNAILNQDYSDLIVNANGLGIGAGELWFTPSDSGEFMLYAINPF